MSAPGTPALRIRSAAAASPPNPPPTICAFIGLLRGLRVFSGRQFYRKLFLSGNGLFWLKLTAKKDRLRCCRRRSQFLSRYALSVLTGILSSSAEPAAQGWRLAGSPPDSRHRCGRRSSAWSEPLSSALRLPRPGLSAL